MEVSTDMIASANQNFNSPPPGEPSVRFAGGVRFLLICWQCGHCLFQNGGQSCLMLGNNVNGWGGESCFKHRLMLRPLLLPFKPPLLGNGAY